MTLEDLKLECEKDESRMDGAHARIDKLSDEGSKDGTGSPSTSGKARISSAWKAFAVIVGIMAVAAVSLWHLGVIPFGSGDKQDVSNASPVIDSWSITNSMNGMRIWINASDSDNNISSISIAIFPNASQLGNPVFEKLYWVNLSRANISAVLFLNILPAGDYVIEAHAVDEAGKTSDSSGFLRFTLPS